MADATVSQNLRTCKVCGKTALLSAFPAVHHKNKDGSLWFGFRTECKKCTNEARQKRIAADPGLKKSIVDSTKRSYLKLSAKRIAEVTARQNRLKAEDPEAFNAKCRAAHAKRAANDEWKDRRRGKQREFDRKRMANPEIRKKYTDMSRRRRNSDPEEVKKHRLRSLKWQKNNKEAANARHRRHKARKRGADGSHTAADIHRILQEQDFRCAWCGCDISGGRHHADHAVPLSRGGGNGPENIVAACPSCNCRKGAKTPDEFKEFLARA